jgi:hypothetical protein
MTASRLAGADHQTNSLVKSVTSLQAMNQSGVTMLYADRQAASTDMARDLIPRLNSYWMGSPRSGPESPVRVLPHGGAGGDAGPQPGQELPPEQMSDGRWRRSGRTLGTGALAPPGGSVPVTAAREPWRTPAAGATIPGWLVITTRPGCSCSWPLWPWTGPGPRGRSNGYLLPPPS